VVQAFLRLGQSVPVYRALRALCDGPGFAALDDARRRIVERGVKDAELAGVALEGAALERFQAIELGLADLATRFSNRLLDAPTAFALTLTARDEVDGLPPPFLAAAAVAAAAAGAVDATPEHGPWRVTLEGPVYTQFLAHARRRDLRERLYRAY